MKKLYDFFCESAIALLVLVGVFIVCYQVGNFLGIIARLVGIGL